MFAENITRKEWAIVGCLSIAVILISFIPYLYGVSRGPNNKVLTGVVTISHYDTYTYLAWMEQAREGRFLFKDLYSSESQPNLLFHPLFWILGLAAKVTALPNILIYHLSRIVLGLLFFWTAYRFICYFFETKLHRLTAFALLATSSGLGILFLSYSSDLWMTEYITFLNIYQSPLNTFSLTLILLIFIEVLSKFEKPSIKSIVPAALLINLLVIVHSYDLLIVAVVGGSYCAYRYLMGDKPFFKNYLYLMLFSFPSILWQAYVLVKNPSLAVWATMQTSVPSYHLIYYVTGYGFLWLFALLGAILVWRGKLSKRYALPLLWVLTVSVFLYLPLFYRFQRKFSEGLHIPVVILAALSIAWLIKHLAGNKIFLRRVILACLIAYFSLTNLYVLQRDVALFRTGEYPYYVTTNEQGAMLWLRDNTGPNSVVLSGYDLGNLIPGISGKTVYLGNGDQTVDFYQKYELAEKVIVSPQKNTDALRFFLQDNNISHIVVDSEMKSWGPVDFSNRPYLSQIYKNADVEIYQVKL